MKLLVSLEQCSPSIEGLNELGINCIVTDNGMVAIDLDENGMKLVVNAAAKKLLSSSQYDIESLSSFIIKKHRIIASGNLKKNDDDSYICDGPFRIFSNIKVTTFDYILAGQIDISGLDQLNEDMLNSTITKTKEN